MSTLSYDSPRKASWHTTCIDSWFLVRNGFSGCLHQHRPTSPRDPGRPRLDDQLRSPSGARVGVSLLVVVPAKGREILDGVEASSGDGPDMVKGQPATVGAALAVCTHVGTPAPVAKS